MGGIFSLGGQIFIKTLKLLVVPLVFVSRVWREQFSRWKQYGANRTKNRRAVFDDNGYRYHARVDGGEYHQSGAWHQHGRGNDFPGEGSAAVHAGCAGHLSKQPVAAMAEGNMLQIIVFALLLGVALTRAGDAGLALKASFDRWNEVIMQLVMMLMLAAPVGVFCLMVTLGAQLGFGRSSICWPISSVCYCAGATFFDYVSNTHQTTGPSKPSAFYQHMAPVMAFAFSTASSGATLPVTLETVKKRIGVRNEIASFVVPVGATINMDGTAIMQGVATVFIAQAFNVDIGLTGYLMVILTATMASIGTAAVPGVG